MVTLNLQNLALELYLQQPDDIYKKKLIDRTFQTKEKTDLQSPETNHLSTKHSFTE